jgi:transposase
LPQANQRNTEQSFKTGGKAPLTVDHGFACCPNLGIVGMITIPAGTRILLATRPVDFRKGAHGLAALAQEVLAEDPFSGAVIVYRSKRADRVKLLVWDQSGLVLVWKQLQQQSFRWPPIKDGVMTLSPVAFAALFDGLDWTRVQTTKPIPKPAVAA